MNSAVIHDSLLLVMATLLVRLGPLVPVKFRMPFAPRTFLARVVGVRLNEPRTAGLAVYPPVITLSQQLLGPGVIAWNADLVSFGFDGRPRTAFALSGGFWGGISFDDGLLGLIDNVGV